MNLQDVSHIHIPDGDVRMIHDSDNRLLWGAVGYNVLFSGNTFQQSYTGKNLLGLKKPSSNTFGFEPVVAEESGTITVNGTFTGGGGGFPWISDRQLSIPAGTYTFSMKNPQSFNVSLRMFDAQGQYTSGKYIAAGATSGTFTLEYDCVRVAILIGAFSVGKTLNNQKFEELQLEAGSTATSFEPYVGGTASPNPDYPQQIQTVTGLQTVTVTGKNLFDETATPWVKGIAYNTAGLQYWSGYYGITGYQPVEASTQYTFSNDLNKPIHYGIAYYDLGKTLISTTVSDTTTFTTPANCAYIRFAIESSIAPTWAQLELGSTATAYAPYHATNYPISLGTIELCKLDTYQDYIWKDGNDWKVHKATGYILMSGGETENWDTDTSSGYTRMDITLGDAKNYGSIRKAIGYCDRFTLSTENAIGIFFANRDHYYFYPQATITTLEQWKSWLASNNTDLYYVLATPTDTAITDTTLIAQLEAIYNLVRRYGYNFVVSASGNNLPIIIDRTLL